MITIGTTAITAQSDRFRKHGETAQDRDGDDINQYRAALRKRYIEKFLQGTGAIDLDSFIKLRRDRLKSGDIVNHIDAHPPPQGKYDQDKVRGIGMHQPVFGLLPEQPDKPVDQRGFQRAECKPENDPGYDR